MAGLGFFGLLSSSLQMTISSNFITGGYTTDPISVTATNTSGGTLSYLWKTKGISATINTPTASSTTVTFGGALGTSELYCDITDSGTGTTYPSPSCFITWTVSPPDAPTIGTSSSADKSFTINWTAPTDDGGSAITGYYLQNSTNNGVSWSGDVSLNNPSATSYNWFGNGIIFDGSAYIGRVAAVNSIGQGPYSVSSSPPRIPTFAAPKLNSFISIDPSTISPPALTRPFIINFTPTACIDYYRTYIYIKSPYESFGNYYDDVNDASNNLFTPTTDASQNTDQIYNVYAVNNVSGGLFYTNGPSQTFNAYCRTFNNDGYYVDSSINNFTTIAPQPVYTYNPAVLDASSTNAVVLPGYAITPLPVTLTGSGFDRNTTNIQSNNWLVSRMDVSAAWRTPLGAVRNFLCDPSCGFQVFYNDTSSSTTGFVGFAPPNNSVPPFSTLAKGNTGAARATYLLNPRVNYGSLGKGTAKAQATPYLPSTGSYGYGSQSEITLRLTFYGQIRTPTGNNY